MVDWIVNCSRRTWACVDTWSGMTMAVAEDENADGSSVDIFRAIAFILLHLAALAVIAVGWSPTAVLIAVALYVVRMFAVTAFYHRYFSPRSFSTSRFWQFCFAVLGNAAAQRGPLWWASYHCHHHKHSDDAPDHHSPGLRGLLWSRLGWILSKQCSTGVYARVYAKGVMGACTLGFTIRVGWRNAMNLHSSTPPLLHPVG